MDAGENSAVSSPGKKGAKEPLARSTRATPPEMSGVAKPTGKRR